MGSWRRKHAADAAEGMWAHVTLIYPFRDSSALSSATTRAVASALDGFASFSFSLARTSCFRSPRVVLYLEPEPSTPFTNLIRALTAAFPDTPPYGGAFDEIVPHLSVADQPDPDLLALIEADLWPQLPIHARAREVELVEHRAERWRLRHRFTLQT